ncbi:hypothetical protein HDU88_002559 [Geranomyces variabilis]|nr:hypothetical protein HDU88_002559 [Geranomyces variabilis]
MAEARVARFTSAEILKIDGKVAALVDAAPLMGITRAINRSSVHDLASNESSWVERFPFIRRLAKNSSRL